MANSHGEVIKITEVVLTVWNKTGKGIEDEHRNKFHRIPFFLKTLKA